MDPKKYKNIVFDFGGVILNIDPGLTIDALYEMAHKDIADQTHKIITDPLFHQFEMGQVSEQEFRNATCKMLGIKNSDCTDGIFDEAWNAMLLDIPLPRLDLIESLAPGHRLFLLSNTNSIHIRKVSEIVQETIGKPSIDHLFENTYYSHLVNMRKPNRDIFELVLWKNNLKPSDTIFLDDMPINFPGAQSAGIATLEVNRDLVEIFN